MVKAQTALYAAGAVAALAALWYVKNKVLPEIAPWNPNNIVNRNVIDVYQGITGSAGSIGTDLYDATHGGALDVSSPNNWAYRAVNASWQAVGVLDENETIGTKLYDFFN